MIERKQMYQAKCDICGQYMEIADFIYCGRTKKETMEVLKEEVEWVWRKGKLICDLCAHCSLKDTPDKRG